MNKRTVLIVLHALSVLTTSAVLLDMLDGDRDLPPVVAADVEEDEDATEKPSV